MKILFLLFNSFTVFTFPSSFEANISRENIRKLIKFSLFWRKPFQHFISISKIRLSMQKIWLNFTIHKFSISSKEETEGVKIRISTRIRVLPNGSLKCILKLWYLAKFQKELVQNSDTDAFFARKIEKNNELYGNTNEFLFLNRPPKWFHVTSVWPLFYPFPSFHFSFSESEFVELQSARVHSEACNK